MKNTSELLVRQRTTRTSLMSEVLIDAPPDQSVADLLAYLMTPKG